ARPHETASEGIAWATPVPSYHIASPLVVGDRVFAMSYPADLVCLRKSDGKVLWIRTTTYYDLLGDKNKRDNPAYAEVAPLVAELEKIDAAYVEQGTLSEEVIKRRSALHAQITALMGKADPKYAGQCGHYVAANMPTPVSDGKHVYVWSELGIATCFDLDGNRKWIAMPGIHNNAVGRYASPVLADGKLIVFDGQGNHKHDGLVAFDMRTGEVAWSMPHDTKSEPFSSLVPLRVGNEDVVLYGRYLVRARDGKILLENGKDLVCHVPTPVIEDGTLYGITCAPGDLIKAKLPTDPANMVMTNEGKIRGLGGARTKIGESFIGSVVCHDGLLYAVDQTGYLYVIDVATQEIVTERDLGMGKVWPYDFYHAPNWERCTTLSSPIVAGKYVYVFGMNGTTVVFETGREYREVARNKIEDSLLSRESRWFRGREMPEHFASSPVAEGGRIYVRGGTYLYCLGKK
ncbi:MAG TPA: PQQ-binding-like beta-propeller repeat protein, partial [Planctomycetota bacterium]|nr:PQQ-binding-like beta-propeller repeat protein [Planctomycetota bacterium]